MEQRKITVGEHGYVALKDWMGDDLSPVNDAKVSFDKESSELGERERRLLTYLAEHQHTSPFRHSVLKFEVYAPLMVARQWWKHVIGSEHGEGYDRMTAWNESSRRYITEEPTFLIPGVGEWRSIPENRKQGSGDNVDPSVGAKYTEALRAHVQESLRLYEQAMKDQICPEQARLFLPAYGLYVRWVWTGSLQAVAHFLKLRLDQGAQKEIRDYAEAVEELTREKFPVALEALLRF
ncbi:MAG TPA: FAD-dependent thymidylate synthase [Firmicutes bacterium]|jgi:thymidylate synthase (FAD)|nr:FAD-dependent thymidylate synthase [Bacillota bacterium]